MDNNETTFRVLDWAFGGIAGLLSLLWTGQNKRISDLKKDHAALIGAAREDSLRMVDELKTANERMSNHITKLFENADRDRAETLREIHRSRERSDERHSELTSYIHDALNKKADKP